MYGADQPKIQINWVFRAWTEPSRMARMYTYSIKASYMLAKLKETMNSEMGRLETEKARANLGLRSAHVPLQTHLNGP